MSKRCIARIYLKFDVVLAQIVNVIVYAEYENVIQIGFTRNVLLGYSNKKMNTDQTEALCHSYKILSPKFIGVFSMDNVPDLAEEVLHVQSFSRVLSREYRSVQTQELFSNVCGHYCIFYMS